MTCQKSGPFDLTKRRPKVLLFGNGLIWETCVPWQELIRKVKRPEADIEKYMIYEGSGEDRRFVGFRVPNTVMTLATSLISDGERHNKYGEVLNPTNQTPSPLLKKLLLDEKGKLSYFDAVLTTNYTYEAEALFHERYPTLTDRSKAAYAVNTAENGDAKFLLHTCNKLKTGPEIWHIHGELRRPSSIVLSHDEYARLVGELMKFNSDRRDDYLRHQTDLLIESWVDYFLMGDVYILGFGMDFSEFDLWWLLGRRLREKAGCGKCVFYEPEKADNQYKLAALADAGVTVKTCGVSLTAGGTYAAFYDAAIADIHAELKDAGTPQTS